MLPLRGANSENRRVGRRVRSVIGSLAFGCAVLLCAGCAKPPQLVQDLSGRENLSDYKLTIVRGMRDGDLLTAHLGYSNGPSSLLVDLRFTIGSPTTLRAGSWIRARTGQFPTTGSVAARSIMFLGGQNDSPSIGGTYDLLDSNGTAAYRIFIPTTQLAVRVPGAPRESR